MSFCASDGHIRDGSCGEGGNARTHARTHTQRKTTDDGGVCVAVSPYSMTRSFEAFGLSANSWQLRTLNPNPSQACPLISADLMVIGSKPVFSTLNVLFRVKFGSFTFVSETKKNRDNQKIQLNVSKEEKLDRTYWNTHTHSKCIGINPINSRAHCVFGYFHLGSLINT